MLLIHILRVFLQKDRKKSLQRELLEHPNPLDEELYSKLIYVSEKQRYKRDLSLEEIKFLATYYRSFQNERNGRTLRFMQASKDKRSKQ